MSTQHDVSGIEALITRFETGTLTRRELIASLAAVGASGIALESAHGASIGVPVPLAMDGPRKVILERILNHKIKYPPEFTARGWMRDTLSPVKRRGHHFSLEDKHFTVFDTSAEHQRWFFSTGEYADIGLTSIIDGNYGAFEEDIHDHPGAPLTSDSARAAWTRAVRYSNYFSGPDAVRRGDTTGSNYDFDDLYGLVKAKIQWTCEHCTEEAIILLLAALNQIDKACMERMLGRDYAHRNLGGWNKIKELFQGAEDPVEIDWDGNEGIIKRYFGLTAGSSVSSHTTY